MPLIRCYHGLHNLTLIKMAGKFVRLILQRSSGNGGGVTAEALWSDTSRLLAGNQIVIRGASDTMPNSRIRSRILASWRNHLLL